MSGQLTVAQKCEVFINKLESNFVQLTSEANSELKFKQEAMFAIQLIKANDYLANIAYSNSESLRNAVLNIASIGLTLNPTEKKAYLIPRKGSICLDISYIGLVDIAVATGMIKHVNAKVVHEKDTFEYKGTTVEPIHNFNPFSERGKKIGVYCTAITSDNHFLTEMMSIEECYEIRNRSESYSKKKRGPWVTDESEMMKKTVIKRASKLWPKNNLSKRLDTAISAINEHEGINFKAEQEEQDRIAEQAYKDRKEQEKKDKQRKEEIIQSIGNTCKDICEGMDTLEKMDFMTTKLKVSNWNDLYKKKITELEEIVTYLETVQV